MKRIDIVYGGEHYSIGGRELADVREEIEAGLAGGIHWLEVNDGEGAMRRAFLSLTPGTPIAVVPIPETGADDEDEDWSATDQRPQLPGIA